MVHIVTHVHHDYMTEENAFALNPIFRLPYNIHTRSVNAKWLMEISQNHNPIWIYEGDAKRLGIKRGDAIKLRVVDTVSGIEVGYFVGMAIPTQATRPGVVACSHHSGRWRIKNTVKVDKYELGIMRYGTALADIKEEGTVRKVRWIKGVERFKVTKQGDEFKWPYPEFNEDMEYVWWKRRFL